MYTPTFFKKRFDQGRTGRTIYYGPANNPKISDIYNLFNKWRKNNLGVRTGKELFVELEQQINKYNDINRDSWWQGFSATV